MTSICLFSLFLSVLIGVTFALEKPCGDWAPFKDEKCFKVFDSIALQNYTEAEATCAVHDNGKLIEISTQEEQDFLVNLFFKQKQVVDSLWLGAKVTGSVFHWEDGSNLTFSNWASGEPKNQADHCAQMNAEGETKGKWVEMLCKKKNLVVCQKKQTLSLAHMQEILIRVENELFSKEGKFFKVENELVSKEKRLLQVEKELVSKEGRLVKVENALSSNGKRLLQVEANSVPIGFIYVQLPKEKEPAAIWPSMSWTDVTSAYAGVFFRAEGGDSDSFGSIQGENAPRFDQVEAEHCQRDSTGNCHYNSEQFYYSPSVSVPRSGWSSYVGSYKTWPTGAGGWNHQVIHRYHSSGGEVRPRNMAIKVWKRSA